MENMNHNANNEGISFVELFSLLKKNIILIAVVTWVFTIIGGVYGKFIKKPVYSATATAIIQVDNGNISGNGMSEYNAFVYAQYLVNSMSEFIISDNVTKEVAKVLIDEQYEMIHTEKDGVVVSHFSNLEQKEYTLEEYEKLVVAKANVVKGGTKISYNDESLILKITYSLQEVDENTDEEVIRTVNLIIKKTKEVSVTLKNQTPTYTFPKIEAIKAVVKAYEKKYNVDIITNEANNVNDFAIISVEGDFSYTEEELNEKLGALQNHISNDVNTLRNNFIVYYDKDSLVLAIKTTEESKELDEEIASHCLVYLNNYALENPMEKYVDEFLYPTFANKLVEMNNQPSYATKSTKTVLIIIIAFIVGLAVSCGIVLVRYLLDDTFKSRVQLEEATGINVLTSIPKFNTKEVNSDENE